MKTKPPKFKAKPGQMDYSKARFVVGNKDYLNWLSESVR